MASEKGTFVAFQMSRYVCYLDFVQNVLFLFGYLAIIVLKMFMQYAKEVQLWKSLFNLNRHFLKMLKF